MQSRTDLQRLPQTEKLQQIKSSPLNEYYDPVRDQRFNHIVEPPKLKIGHPLQNYSVPQTTSSNFIIFHLFISSQVPDQILSFQLGYLRVTHHRGIYRIWHQFLARIQDCHNLIFRME